MLKLVMCFGAFDLFHLGHQFFIEQCLQLGEKLIIVIARDINIIKQKKHQPLFCEKERLATVQTKFPNCTVLLGDENDFFLVIKKYKPHIICLGYDQFIDEKEIKFQFPDIKIFKIKPFKSDKYKSSLLKEKM